MSSKASGPPRTNMARSKIKPPRVLQRPCGKSIKWSYRGQNGDEIFNGLDRERDKYVHNKHNGVRMAAYAYAQENTHVSVVAQIPHTSAQMMC